MKSGSPAGGVDRRRQHHLRGQTRWPRRFNARGLAQARRKIKSLRIRHQRLIVNRFSRRRFPLTCPNTSRQTRSETWAYRAQVVRDKKDMSDFFFCLAGRSIKIHNLRLNGKTSQRRDWFVRDDENRGSTARRACDADCAGVCPAGKIHAGKRLMKTLV